MANGQWLIAKKYTTMEKKIAKELLSINAVFLRPEQPFTWASGIKSPIYCDNRLILTAPSVREQVEAGLAELVKKHFPECEVLMGTSTAGIAHAAIVATILDLLSPLHGFHLLPFCPYNPSTFFCFSPTRLPPFCALP